MINPHPPLTHPATIINPPSLSTITPKPIDQIENQKLIKQKIKKEQRWVRSYRWVSFGGDRWQHGKSKGGMACLFGGLFLRSLVVVLRFIHQWRRCDLLISGDVGLIGEHEAGLIGDRWEWGWTDWWTEGLEIISQHEISQITKHELMKLVKIKATVSI